MIPLSDGVPTRRRPVVTIALLVVTVAVWVLYQLPDLGGSVRDASFYPCSVDVTGACTTTTPWWLAWLSSMFLHAGWGHLIGNMVFLAIFGNNVEDAFGRGRYLALYLAGGLVATMTQSAVTLAVGTPADAHVPMVGASGAIAAVLGAYLVLYPGARVLTLLGWFPLRIPAVVYLGGWFLYQLVESGLGLVSPESGSGVAFFAHIGGFVFGLVVTSRLLATGGIRTPARSTAEPRSGRSHRGRTPAARTPSRRSRRDLVGIGRWS